MYDTEDSSRGAFLLESCREHGYRRAVHIPLGLLQENYIRILLSQTSVSRVSRECLDKMYGGTRMSIPVLPFQVAHGTTRGIGTCLIHSSSLQQRLWYRGEWVLGSLLKQHSHRQRSAGCAAIGEVSAYLRQGKRCRPPYVAGNKEPPLR